MSTFFQSLHPKRLRQRLFANMNSSTEHIYEPVVAGRKRALFGQLHGSLLEIGPGSGPNLRYYPADVRWVGVEPNPYMQQRLEQTILALGSRAGNFRIHSGDPSGCRLPAEDESVDAVVSTLVLCSVPDPAESLREILRVLKPGGRFVFIEHVAAPHGDRRRPWQEFLQPLYTLVADGCHPNRETWETIARAGFAQVEIEHFEFPDAGLVGPHIAGTAVKGLK